MLNLERIESHERKRRLLRKMPRRRRSTFFQLPTRKLYTWKCPQDEHVVIITNHIDYTSICRNLPKSRQGGELLSIGGSITSETQKITETETTIIRYAQAERLWNEN